MKKFGILLLVLVGFGIKSFAQPADIKASAETKALLVHTLAISNVASSALDFGTISITTAAGTVVQDPSASRTSSGGASLVTSGAGTAASFEVTGDESLTYKITFPGTITLINDAHEITADTWTTSLGTLTDGVLTDNVLTGGSQTFTVGGTLHIPANTTPGPYSAAANSSGLQVTVVYE